MRRTWRSFIASVFLFGSSVAWAQRIVVIEIDGDKNGVMRAAIENAVRKTNKVRVVPYKEYKAAAAKRKLSVLQAASGPGIEQIALSVAFDIAITGFVATKLSVQFFDAHGAQVWKRQLPLKKGRLSDDLATKLARAAVAAAQSIPQGPDPSPPEPLAAPPVDAAPPRQVEKPAEESTVSDAPVVPAEESGGRRKPKPKIIEVSPEDAAAILEPQTAPPRKPAEPFDEDLEIEANRRGPKIGPRVFKVWVAGETVWRSYCARPGVTSCAEYDESVRGGVTPAPGNTTVDFYPSAPYFGFLGTAELFPIAAATDNAAQGIGLLGSFGLGFSSVRYTQSIGAGMTSESEVTFHEISFSGELAYRLYFSIGNGTLFVDVPKGDPLVAHIGVHGGVGSKQYVLRSNVAVPLPGGYRLYPQVGGDASLPFAKAFRLDVSGSYFISPKPGLNEIVGFGNPSGANGGATSSGFELMAGISGDLVGPLGYAAKARYDAYIDQFYGAGQKWNKCTEPNCGGAAFETYFSVLWGLTLGF